MKKLLLVIVFITSSCKIFASIPLHLGLCELGLNFGQINKSYKRKFPGFAGYDVGVKYKSYLFDVGVLLWSNEYRNELTVLNQNNQIVKILTDSAEVNSTSITLSAGKTYNIRKIHFAAKGILAPTFLHKHTVNLSTDYKNPPIFEPNTKGFYLAGGYEIRVGYFISPYMVVDLKYTFVSYFNQLNYNKSEVYNFSLHEKPKNERPVLHSLGVQLNFFFEKHEPIFQKRK